MGSYSLYPILRSSNEGRHERTTVIAITGAGGFIGSHLVDAVLARGEEVLALDLAPKAPPNLTPARDHAKFRYLRCDVTSEGSVRKALSPHPDVVFHAAAGVGVASYVRNPMEIAETNFLGTRNVLRTCIEPRVRFVYFSSSEVFGRNPKVPWKEESDRVLGDPTLHRWTYSTSKGLSEHLVNAARQEYGVPTTIVRPFNIYGPRQRPDFVIPITVHRVLNGKSPIVYGDGNQTRCFTYVADLIEALLLCLDRDTAVGETFNLGNPLEWTMNDAVQKVLEICGGGPAPVHIEHRAAFGAGFDEIPRRVPEVSKAARLLGWKARTALEDGVRLTAEWARANPEWLRRPLN